MRHDGGRRAEVLSRYVETLDTDRSPQQHEAIASLRELAIVAIDSLRLVPNDLAVDPAEVLAAAEAVRGAATALVALLDARVDGVLP